MSETLNERQMKAIFQIKELCRRIGNDHWFTTAELYEVGLGTLGALEKRGYVIPKKFFDDKNTGFQALLIHWQWTGKVIENESECVDEIVKIYQRALDKEKSVLLEYELEYWKEIRHNIEEGET